jgi:hypothetical protein
LSSQYVELNFCFGDIGWPGIKSLSWVLEILAER